MAPILTIDRLTKYFAGLAALRDVSFEVGEAQICGLIGPNGAGKTTLFSIISGSLAPTSGKISFRGSDFTGIKPFRAVQAGIARTHQIARPFRSMTVVQNVEVGIHYCGRRRPGSVQKEAIEVLKLVGLEHAAHQPASTLCVGDQKRLELARTLATKPRLLLCDEVCGGLTEKEMMSILDLLRRIQALGTTIVYVEHNLKAIMSVCHHVVVLNFGQKLAEGPPHVMQKDPAVIEAYIGKTAAA